jgi:hypothetical protein
MEDQSLDKWEFIIGNKKTKEKYKYTAVNFDKQTKSGLNVLKMFAESDFHIKFVNEPIYSVQNLDMFFSAWLNVDFNVPGNLLSRDELVFALTLAFGKYMIETYNFVWKDKDDGKTIELILWHSDKFDIEMQPISYINKAIHDHEKKIFSMIEDSFLHAIEMGQNQ